MRGAWPASTTAVDSRRLLRGSLAIAARAHSCKIPLHLARHKHFRSKRSRGPRLRRAWDYLTRRCWRWAASWARGFSLILMLWRGWCTHPRRFLARGFGGGEVRWLVRFFFPGWEDAL